VWRPELNRVAAVAPLPGSSPENVLTHEQELAFVKGRDLVLDECGPDPAARA